MISQIDCAKSQSLAELVQGQMHEAEQQQFEQHIESCRACQQVLDTLVEGDQTAARVVAHLRRQRPESEEALLDAMDKIRSTTCGENAPMESNNCDLALDFLNPSDDAESLGSLGTYEIHEVIGNGGMGVVLKGEDAKLKRVVAIKVLAPELASNATARQRFLREARAAAAVGHPHVVTIHAVDEDRLPYLVMELVNGQSLQQKIDRDGPVELKRILRIGAQIASGLAAAHDHGLIHRDIKPGNILLENGVERVKITDFGLARAVDDAAITRTGEVTGTPQYMSPEQAEGQAIDRRSDLFSLGSVIYAMCTGRSPFRAETTLASLRRVCDDTPRPIREINPDIPHWLVEIVDRLLEKNPEARSQTAAEVADLLGQRLAHVQNPELTSGPNNASANRQKSPRGRSLYRWSIAASLLLGVLALATITEATGTTKFTGTAIRLATGEGTLVIEVDDPSVKVSLDGEVLSITGAGIEELKLRPGQYQFRATKDGRDLKHQLVTIRRGDREVVKVTCEPAATTAIVDKKSRASISIPKGAITEIGRLDRHGNTSTVAGLTFSPDDAQLLSTRHPRFAEVWNLKTRQPAFVKETGIQLAVKPRQNVFVTASYDRDSVKLWSLDTLRLIAEFTSPGPPHRNGYVHISVSPDAQHVAAAGHDGVARVWNVESEKQIHQFTGAGKCLIALFSPDGRSLLAGFPTKLQLLDLKTGKEIWGEADPGYIPAAAYSPSGRWIVVSNSRTITLREAATGEVSHRFEGHDHAVTSLEFLPDSRHFLSGAYDRTMRLWSIETGREVARVTTPQYGTTWVAVSHDGRQAASGGGRFFNQMGLQKDGDYAIRLWQLPQSVWSKQPSPASRR